MSRLNSIVPGSGSVAAAGAAAGPCGAACDMHQDRAQQQPERKDRTERPVLDLLPGHVQDAAVDQFHRDRLAGEGVLGRLDGGLGRAEVADADDPAVPVIEKLQADFPLRSIRLVKNVARLGTNSKVNSLCRLVQEAKYELLVMSDSDVRVEPGYLREAAAPFANSAVGAVTAFCQCLSGGSIAADLDALGMCLDSVPSALVARNLVGVGQIMVAVNRPCGVRQQGLGPGGPDDSEVRRSVGRWLLSGREG